MASDSQSDSIDSLINDSADDHGDFIPLILAAVKKVNVSFFLLIFAAFLLISSDVFTHRILDRFQHATSGGIPTSYGKVIQGIILVFCCMILDILGKAGVL